MRLGAMYMRGVRLATLAATVASGAQAQPVPLGDLDLLVSNDIVSASAVAPAPALSPLLLGALAIAFAVLGVRVLRTRSRTARVLGTVAVLVALGVFVNAAAIVRIIRPLEGERDFTAQEMAQVAELIADRMSGCEQLSDATITFNAHGRTFDSAGSWINNDQVQIALDAEYDQVTMPPYGIGDILVYRRNGLVTYTATVTEVDDGQTIVQVYGKWGAAVECRHAPSDVPPTYGTDFEIWRSKGASEPPIFQAIADCGPTSGQRPLAVQFRSRGEFSDGSIIRYRWDFQGDGTFDRTDTVAFDATFTFQQAGTYNAVLEVMNNLNQIDTDVCMIVVGGNPPMATANATPSNGPIPLQVALTCTGTDADGTIALYEWDFDGNGSFDFSSPTSGNTMHTYTTPGTFLAVCRVTDNDNRTATARTTTTAIRPGPAGSPSVTATASPASGNAPLSVSFNGTATDNGTIVRWEWDFENDGTFDFSSTTSPAATHQYVNGGIFAATLRATDDTGLTGIDTVEVIVNIVATLTIPDDTFDPSAGETAEVRTTLNGGVPTRVFLKDRSGTVVRQLVNQFRPAGTYMDLWDGRNDANQWLPQAPYYAVLEYDFAGEVRSIDLTHSTGGARYNPSRNSIPSTFRPFEDDLLDITFTIPTNPGASEVQLFVGLFNTGERFLELLDRVPFGVGTHTVFWDGLDNQGNLAVPPPGDSFLLGLFGFSLANNAILVASGPNISNVMVDPNFFDPSTPNFLTPDQPVATVTFDLSKLANVTLSVTNLDTDRVLRTVTQLNVQAGTGNFIQWDGLASDGLFADRGDYRLELRAVDSTGSASIVRGALVRVFY